MTGVFKFAPNWAGVVNERHEYSTTIVSSRSGVEKHRAAIRQQPAIKCEWDFLAAYPDMRDFRESLESTDDVIYAPYPLASGQVVIGAGFGGTYIVTSEDVTGAEYLLVQGVAFQGTGVGNTFTFSSPTASEVSFGSKYSPLYAAKIASLRTEFVTQGVVSGSVSVKYLSGNFPALSGYSFANFMGTEVLDVQHNWRDGIEFDLEDTSEEIDFGYGLASYSSPITVKNRVFKISTLFKTRDDVRNFFGFCQQVRGRQKSFFLETTAFRRGALGANTSLGGMTVLVSDNGFLAADHMVRPVEAIKIMQGGAKSLHAVSNVATSPGGSLVYLAEPCGVEYMAGAALVGRLSRVRFLSDVMSVKWITRDVAQAVFQVTEVRGG